MCSLLVLICSVAACCFGERISDAVADGDDRLLLGIAALGAFAVCSGHGAGPDILALMAETAGALSDLETARLAKIVLPGITAAAAFVGFALRANDCERTKAGAFSSGKRICE